jgi:Zn-dependent peptidase ImmA (M78 family)
LRIPSQRIKYRKVKIILAVTTQIIEKDWKWIEKKKKKSLQTTKLIYIEASENIKLQERGKNQI